MGRRKGTGEGRGVKGRERIKKKNPQYSTAEGEPGSTRKMSPTLGSRDEPADAKLFLRRRERNSPNFGG